MTCARVVPDQERDIDWATRAYILKRNLSNAAAHVLTLTLPDWMLAAGCLLDNGGAAATSGNGTVGGVPSAPRPCRRGDSPWRASPMLSLSADADTGARVHTGKALPA